jgi:shikimate dehydrogenase
MVDLYAVIGNPIAHSKSPLIHRTFAEQTHQEMAYEAVLAPIDGFKQTVNTLVANGYKGANVTVPFKFEAYMLCDSLSDRVVSAGLDAVNTLIIQDGRVHGDNTDGIGLRTDIERNIGFSVQGKHVLILGAGGAAHGVVHALHGAKSITVANRTPENALKLATKITDCDAYALEFDALAKPYDLIINATSTGLNDSSLPVPDIVFDKGCLAYDMMYGRNTPFMQQARLAGAKVHDGLGMLVEQAAEAFYLWRGVRPSTQPVMTMLRAAVR